MHSWRMHFVSTVSDVSNSGIQYSSYSKSVEIIDNPENRAPITRIQPRHENIIGCVVSEITATSFAFTPRGTFFGSGFQSAAALHTHNPRPPRFLFIDSGQINENETTSRVIHNEAPGNFHYRVWYNCNSISMNDRRNEIYQTIEGFIVDGIVSTFWNCQWQKDDLQVVHVAHNGVAVCASANS